MVNRVLWGQEQFGGGFCGAGGEAASDVNPLTRKGLRTLGRYMQALYVSGGANNLML